MTSGTRAVFLNPPTVAFVFYYAVFYSQAESLGELCLGAFR